MALGDFIPEGTVQSRLLCEEISKRSDGVCILALSRGKDILGNWIWLTQFFPTIYPFHAASAPNLGIANRSLSYYEDFFGCKIDRYLNGETSMGLQWKMYQPLGRYERLENLKRETYGLEEMAEVIRKKYNCPQAYMAIGQSMNDNIFRRLQLKAVDQEGNLTFEKAMKKYQKTFYPCFDWTMSSLMEAITKNGLALPEDYLLADRSLSPILNAKNSERLMELYPEDFEKCVQLFPLIKAVWARNQFRRMKISGNGVIPRKVSEILKEDRLEHLEQEVENARNSNERKPGKRLANRG